MKKHDETCATCGRLGHPIAETWINGSEGPRWCPECNARKNEAFSKRQILVPDAHYSDPGHLPKDTSVLLAVGQQAIYPSGPSVLLTIIWGSLGERRTLEIQLREDEIDALMSRISVCRDFR